MEISPIKLISNNDSSKKPLIDYLIPPTTLGRKIKNLRIKEGLTFKEFTKRLKVSKDTTWRIEKGISIPDGKTLKRMAKILKMDLEAINYGEFTALDLTWFRGLRGIWFCLSAFGGGMYLDSIDREKPVKKPDTVVKR